MIEFLIGGISFIAVFVTGSLMGTLSGKGELRDQVSKIVKETVSRSASPAHGPVRQLDPSELAKQKSRELIDRLNL